MALYGYARISSKTQENNSSLQTQYLRLVQAGVPAHNVFQDVQTGTTLKRAGLQKLLNVLEKEDKVLIIRLDRAARTLRESLRLLSEIEIRGAVLGTLEADILSATPAAKLSFAVLAAASEYEMDVRKIRIAEGIAAKKLADYKYMGRKPRLTNELKEKFYITLNSGVTNRHELCRVLKISPRTLTNYYRRGLLH